MAEDLAAVTAEVAADLGRPQKQPPWGQQMPSDPPLLKNDKEIIKNRG